MSGRTTPSGILPPSINTHNGPYSSPTLHLHIAANAASPAAGPGAHAVPVPAPSTPHRQSQLSASADQHSGPSTSVSTSVQVGTSSLPPAIVSEERPQLTALADSITCEPFTRVLFAPTLRFVLAALRIRPSPPPDATSAVPPRFQRSVVHPSIGSNTQLTVEGEFPRIC